MTTRIQNSGLLPTLQDRSSSIPVYATSISKAKSLYEYYVLNPVRTLVRPLFFPLFSEISLKQEAQLKKEEQFFTNFWDSKSPLYPELSHHKMIKDHFNHKNQDFAITLKGQQYTVRCSVIESKDYVEGKESYNIVHVLGNISKINNTIMHTYPLLTSYLDLKGDKHPARFILINQYSIYSAEDSIYKPETISEAGLILSETLKAVEESYGTIHQLISYSLGVIVTAAALKYFHKDLPKNDISLSFLQIIWNQIACFFNQIYEGVAYPLIGRITFIQSDDESILKTTRVFKSLPKHIMFDRGPASIEKLSDRYMGGSILLPLARLSDWDVDIGKEISNFMQHCEINIPSITVVSALQDHRFHGDANLCAHPDIKKLTKEGKVTSLLLDVCVQSLHENAQHSFNLGNWYGSHLVEGYKEQKFLQRDQNLATAIIKNSIPLAKKRL